MTEEIHSPAIPLTRAIGSHARGPVDAAKGTASAAANAVGVGRDSGELRAWVEGLLRAELLIEAMRPRIEVVRFKARIAKLTAEAALASSPDGNAAADIRGDVPERDLAATILSLTDELRAWEDRIGRVDIDATSEEST